DAKNHHRRKSVCIPTAHRPLPADRQLNNMNRATPKRSDQLCGEPTYSLPPTDVLSTILWRTASCEERQAWGSRLGSVTVCCCTGSTDSRPRNRTLPRAQLLTQPLSVKGAETSLDFAIIAPLFIDL